MGSLVRTAILITSFRMGRHKQVLCKVCYKEMRSDVLTRHMKVHETSGGSKRTHNEMEEEDAEALKKYLIKKQMNIKKKLEKIALGERVYRILGQGEVLEEALPEEMKDALDIYMKQAHEFNNYAHCYYKNANKKHMNKEDARKGYISVDEVRNIINDGFDGFTEYMMMKLQPTEVEDEERIEESLNVFKHYMLHKINE